MAPKNSVKVDTMQTSIIFDLETIRQLTDLQREGFGTITNIITVAVDRLYWRWMDDRFTRPVKASTGSDAIQCSIRLNRATVDQLDRLRAEDLGTQSALIIYAIKAMHNQLTWQRQAAEVEDREAIMPGDYHYFNPRASERPATDEEYAALAGFPTS